MPKGLPGTAAELLFLVGGFSALMVFMVLSHFTPRRAIIWLTALIGFCLLFSYAYLNESWSRSDMLLLTLPFSIAAIAFSVEFYTEYILPRKQVKQKVKSELKKCACVKEMNNGKNSA